MKALYILLPILLFVLLLLFSRVRLSLVYDGRIQLRISYLFVRIPLYPRKKRRPKASAKRKNRKRSSHAQKMKIIAEAPEEKPRSEPPKKAPLRLGDIRFLLRLFREVIAHVLDSSSRHVRIRVKQLRLSIGGADDAARAAIEYGLVSQSVAYLLEFLKSTGFLTLSSSTRSGTEYLLPVIRRGIGIFSRCFHRSTPSSLLRI